MEGKLDWLPSFPVRIYCNRRDLSWEGSGGCCRLFCCCGCCSPCYPGPWPAPSGRSESRPPQAAAPLAPGFLEARETAAQGEGVTLYHRGTGELLTLSWEEFLPLALACEMDPAAPQEALKAQAVALRSQYTASRGQGPQGADGVCSPQDMEGFASEEVLSQRWGERYQENLALLQEACQQVAGQLLTWEGAPAQAFSFPLFRRGHPPGGGTLPLPRAQPRGRAGRRVPVHPDPDPGGVPGRRRGSRGPGGLLRGGEPVAHRGSAGPVRLCDRRGAGGLPCHRGGGTGRLRPAQRRFLPGLGRQRLHLFCGGLGRRGGHEPGGGPAF